MDSKDDKIIQALLTTNSIKEASKACGVPVRTIYSRRQKEEFKQAYAAARSEALEFSRNKLNSLVKYSISTMAKVMTDNSAPPQTRLNAAEIILRNALKLEEHLQLCEDIAELKKAVFDEHQ